MFLRILTKSFSNRKSRVAIAVIAVLMGASIAGGLLTVTHGIEEKLGAEFRRFGSNIVVTPRSDTIEVGLPGISFGSVAEQRYISENDLSKIKMINNWNANVLGYAPFLYQVVEAKHVDNYQRVVLAGTYFDREIPEVPWGDRVWSTGIRRTAPYWQIDGEWIEDGDSEGTIAGVSVAEKLDLKPGDYIEVTYQNPVSGATATAHLRVVGIVTTGGLEDSQLFVSLPVAQKISDRPNKVHSVQVSGLCISCPAELIAQEIELKLPYVQAKSVKQLVTAEAQIMGQLGQLMVLIAIAVLGASGLCVMMTTTTTVVERRKEIGLMKSIGADNRKIASIFVVESIIVGIIGGVLGYLLGNLIARYIGVSVFGTSLSPVVSVLPVTLGVSLFVTILASVLPVRNATRIEPAVVLRGE